LFLQDLKNQGYKVDRLPADRQEFINELIEHATNDRSFMNDKLIKNSDGKMTFEEYQDFYQILPEKVQKKLEIDWGKAPGEVFKYDDFLLIPGTLNGNIAATSWLWRGS
jgi:cobaltochelatase CobN